MAIWWGPEILQFYNDGYRPFLGAKHPRSMGQRGDECWAEIWDVCGPLYERVMTTGESTWSTDLQLLMERNGYLEETYFTFAYSPIRGETADVLGNLITVTETTERVLGERRLRTLRDLGALAMAGKTPDEAARLATQTLDAAGVDVPFALLYLVDDDGRHARLACTSGIAPGTAMSPTTVELTGSETTWPLARVVTSAAPVVMADLVDLGALPSGPWTDPPHTALVLPLTAGETVIGVLVAAVSPRRALDDSYRGFYDVLAGQIATALANARAHAEERRRAEALAELDRAKTEFFSNVSHEFRTPLTLMLGPIAEALRAPDLLPAERERLAGVERNGLRLLKLVNTLLDFSRIEAGRAQAAYEPVDVGPLTAELASSFESAVEHAGLRLRIDCPSLAEPLWVDREMWEKIVLNLLSNAFKFTFEGEITVRLREAGERVVLEVADTGIGIAADELPHVFERFHRVRGARSRTHEGTGIGLALVDELVRLHGGTIEVESRLGRGTTFAVAIPWGRAHLPADRIGATRTAASTAVEAAAFTAEALRWLPDVVTREAAAPGASGGDGGRILLVDDNADMRQYVARLLRAHWTVDTVADGEDALEHARARPPDLVLSDVMMPRLDGFGLLRALRADARTATIPVILISARAGEDSRVEGLDAGADDYLIKPFTARELVARVNAHLTLARLRRATQHELESFFEHGAVPMCWVGADGTILRANRVELQMLGCAADEYIGRKIDEFHVDADTIADILRRLRNRESIDNYPARLRTKDGSIRHVLISSNVLWDADRFVHACCFTRDVTELRRADEERGRLLAAERAARAEAEEARHAAEEASRAKDEFLAMLAHELRNPLGVVLTGVKILDKIGSTQPEAVRVRTLMTRQTEHLARLIDDLLDVARITRGKIELRKEILDLRTVVDFAVEAERHRLVVKDQRLGVAMAEAPVTVYGDQARLQQVAANLIHNASKYTPSGGHVDVVVEPHGDRAVLRVRDTGIGIPADKLRSVFELFVQLDSSPDRPQGGLGVGLTLVQRLVLQHDGDVEARSEGSGQGSEFVVSLPLARALDDQWRRARPAAKTRRALHILIIEDNEDERELLRYGLELDGHRVDTARDGATGVDLAVAGRPDVAVVDLGLPGLDGLSVARALRATLGMAIRLVALTGYGQSEDRRRTRDAGFDAHIIKPASIEELLAALPD
jgi:PAS domain S-box-containing protein